MPKIKMKVSAGFSGVIATGSYENARPNYSAELEFEMEDLLPEQVSEHIGKVQKQLQDVCYGNFKADEQKSIIERIELERKDFRWYGEFPSATSIINWDADFFVSAEELQQYASQGNIIDAQAKHFIKTGSWEKPEKIEGTWSDIVIVKQGKLGLSLNGWDFPGFLKKYPLEKMEVGGPIISQKHRFGGTPDIRKCFFEGKKTLADVKRTPEKIKHFKQCAAYIIAEEENGAPPYEQMMLIPLNDKTEQGFSKPIVSAEINQYKEMFLRDRENFKKRFGV